MGKVSEQLFKFLLSMGNNHVSGGSSYRYANGLGPVDNSKARLVGVCPVPDQASAPLKVSSVTFETAVYVFMAFCGRKASCGRQRAYLSRRWLRYCGTGGNPRDRTSAEDSTVEV
jgi:hypothetical protein